MPTLVVVNNPKLWPFEIQGVDVVEAKAYLTSPEYGELRGVKLFNLCRSYAYQSTGYYVTLLAAARGHKPLPTIATFQDLRSKTMARVVSEDLDELIQQSLARLQSSQFVLSVYFGRNLAKRYDRLSRAIFNMYQAPMLRARFSFMKKWHLEHVAPVSMGDVPDTHRDFILEVAREYFRGRGPRVKKRKPAKYDLALLANPEEKLPPSDPVAIKRFVKAAEDIGLGVEIISPDDYGRLAEFDALFIRETTSVNHHTYRFSRRAAFEGLVVIDDPESIVKCSNKVFLAELLKRHGVPTPETVVVHRDNMGALAAKLGLPLVLKKPDSSFSKGVVKVSTEEELELELEKFLAESDLVVAQAFRPTDFDWRIGVLDRRPLYACKYFMAKKHWQIYKHEDSGEAKSGPWETIPVELAPRSVSRAAVKAAGLIGDGFYGVDLKQIGDECVVIEVNDNPSIESGVEDKVLRDELYRRLASTFLERIEAKKVEAARA